MTFSSTERTEVHKSCSMFSVSSVCNERQRFEATAKPSYVGDIDGVFTSADIKQWTSNRSGNVLLTPRRWPRRVLPRWAPTAASSSPSTYSTAVHRQSQGRHRAKGHAPFLRSH